MPSLGNRQPQLVHVLRTSYNEKKRPSVSQKTDREQKDKSPVDVAEHLDTRQTNIQFFPK